jgi:hypothetical protein
MCFGLLSHHQALTKNIKKKDTTAIGTRSPPLHVMIHDKGI